MRVIYLPNSKVLVTYFKQLANKTRDGSSPPQTIIIRNLERRYRNHIFVRSPIFVQKRNRRFSDRWANTEGHRTGGK